VAVPPSERAAAVAGLLGRLKVMGLTAETAQPPVTVAGLVVVAFLAQVQPPLHLLALRAACPFGTRLAVLARLKIILELAPPPPAQAAVGPGIVAPFLPPAVLVAQEMNTGP
jgi:hypothetical protein